MKRNLLKTMLVAVGMVAGMSGAWAATDNATVKMTYVDYNNPTTANGEIAAGNTATSGYNKISGGSVGFGNTSWGVNYITYIQVDASAIEGTITGATLSAEVSGSTDSKRQGVYGVGYNSSDWSADLTYETADKAITLLGKTYTTSTKSATTFESAEFDITNALINDDDKVVTILMYETAAAGGYVKNPSVTITYLSEDELSTYTVKYVCGEVEVKEATSGKGAIGGIYTVTEEDKASCIFNDIKYIYVSDDAASQVIAKDGSTVITVTFREAEKYAYTLKSNLGDVITTGSGWEGETLKVAYPRHLNVNGTLYSIAAGDKNIGYYQRQFTLNENNQEEIINYTAGESGVVFLSEAEDIETLTVSTAPNSNVRCSNGLCAYNAGEDDAVIANLPNGKYKLYTSVWGNATTEFVFKAGENQILSISSVGYIQDGNSEEFELNAASTPITLGATGNAGRGIDFVYIIKTGEAPLDVTLSVGEAGLATFCSGYALDFTNAQNIFAYAAKIDGNVVKLTKVTTVAAGEGVLLSTQEQGAQTEAIAIAPSTTEKNDNDFIAVTEDKVLQETEDGFVNYILSNENGVVGFFRANETNIAAGKAYLRVSETSAAKGLRMVFDGDVTGINEVKTAVKTDNAFYTLSGVRVQNPSKGLYIQNGKKVIVK